VSGDTIARHNDLVREAKDFIAAGRATWHEASPVTTRKYSKPQGDKPPLDLLQASSVVRIKFSDFAALAEFVTAITERPGVTVQRVEWALTEETKARLISKARAAAVADAVVRAGEYAAATGATNVPAIKSIVGASLHPGSGSGHGTSARGGASSADAAITPDSIATASAVVVKFTF
jgi:uncharacterized protein YggE